jgi:hypothetical protein
MSSSHIKRSCKKRKMYPLNAEKVYRSKLRLETLLQKLGPIKEINWGQAVGEEVW